MPERQEQGFESIIELLVFPAIVLFESLDVGESKRSEKVRDAFIGLTEVFLLAMLPFLIPFTEIGRGQKKKE